MSDIRAERTNTKIINYTKYSTADLKALIDAIEARTGEAVPKWSPYVTSYSTPVPKEYVFREYTGKVEHHYRYEQGGRIKQGRVFAARHKYRFPLLFRVLPPDALHDNPLEELARSAGIRTPTIPHVMVEELRDRIQSLYGFWGYRGQGTNTKTDVSGLSVRIMKRRDASAPKRDSRAVARERTQRLLMETSSAKEAAEKQIVRLVRSGERLAKQGDTAGFGGEVMPRISAIMVEFQRLNQELERIASAVAPEPT